MRFKLFINVLFASLTILITGCKEQNNSKVSSFYCKGLDIDCISQMKNVVFNTSKGSFIVEVYGDKAPVTSSVFLHNIKLGIYNDTKISEIITLPKTSIILFKPRSLNSKKLSIKKNIPLEIKLKGEKEARYNSLIKHPEELSKLEIKSQLGSIAMNRSFDFDSGGTEFFFLSNRFKEIEGRYTIFGRVKTGMDVLDKLNEYDYIKSIRLINANP